MWPTHLQHKMLTLQPEVDAETDVAEANDAEDQVEEVAEATTATITDPATSTAPIR